MKNALRNFCSHLPNYTELHLVRQYSVFLVGLFIHTYVFLPDFRLTLRCYQAFRSSGLFRGNVLPSHSGIDGSEKDFPGAEIVYKHWIISKLINLFNKKNRHTLDDRPNPSTPQQPAVGHGFRIIEALPSHSDTPHLLRFVWISDRPDAETSTWGHNAHNRHPYPCGIRSRNNSNPAPTDPRLRHHGHCEWSSGPVHTV